MMRIRVIARFGHSVWVPVFDVQDTTQLPAVGDSLSFRTTEGLMISGTVTMKEYCFRRGDEEVDTRDHIDIDIRVAISVEPWQAKVNYQKQEGD